MHDHPQMLHRFVGGHLGQIAIAVLGHGNNVVMATIETTDDDLRVRLSLPEKLFALRGDVTVPRTSITDVERFAEGLDAVAGLRAPGLAIPGRVKIGTWRRRGGKELVLAHRGQPAVRIALRDQPWQALVIGTDDPVGVERSLA